MTRATLSYVSLSSVDPNPFRSKKAPYDQDKLDALEESMKQVGIWEGLIARQVGGRYEIPFGHHRLKAASRLKLSTVPLALRDLTDEQMIQFMGKENLEDYNSNFLVMLASWDAARTFLKTSAEVKDPQPLAIARSLGWTRAKNNGKAITTTADACHAATKLIEAGHIDHDDLSGMSVKAARDIVERTQSRIEMLDKLGTMGKRPAAEITRDKKHIGTAARSVAKDVREGKVGTKNIRTEIDFRSVKSATAKGKASPLFSAFAKEVAESIHKMLVSDNVSTRLAEMEKALPLVSLDEDHAALRRIDFALAEHGQTTATWRERLTPKGRRVVPLKLLKKEA